MNLHWQIMYLEKLRNVPCPWVKLIIVLKSLGPTKGWTESSQGHTFTTEKGIWRIHTWDSRKWRIDEVLYIHIEFKKIESKETNEGCFNKHAKKNQWDCVVDLHTTSHITAKYHSLIIIPTLQIVKFKKSVNHIFVINLIKFGHKSSQLITLY
jgi:hypothetical protein